MSESLQDHMMIEPGLTEAVRIVLKYEIQSLLSRLADTGEEYIVLTARSDDRTCGHMSSEKGEDFVLNSSVQSVKEEFLNFCTGDWLPKQSEKTPSQSLLPKQRRRKSTPRCKFQATNQDTTAYVLDASLPFSSSSEAIISAESATALDLSERKPQVPCSIPVDYSNDSASVNSKPVSPANTNISTPENTMHESLSVVDSRENSNFPVTDSTAKGTVQLFDSVGYSWQEEKFNIKSEEFLPGHGDSGLSAESYNMMYSDGNQQNIAGDKSTQNSFLSEDVVNGGSPSSSQTNTMYSSTYKPQTPKRRARKSHTKVKQEEFTGSASYIPSSAVKEEFGENSFNTSVNEEESDGSFMQSENKSMHPGFTDMKSAFEEIGNMAKCLICNKVLANKNNRTFHWRSHVGDKRYACDICNKAFTHPSNMRSHRKIHTDEKPFPCELCERRFRRRDYLLQHLERFHYNPKQSETLVLDDSYLDVSSNLIESNISG